MFYEGEVRRFSWTHGNMPMLYPAWYLQVQHSDLFLLSDWWLIYQNSQRLSIDILFLQEGKSGGVSQTFFFPNPADYLFRNDNSPAPLFTGMTVSDYICWHGCIQYLLIHILHLLQVQSNGEVYPVWLLRTDDGDIQAYCRSVSGWNNLYADRQSHDSL